MKSLLYFAAAVLMLLPAFGSYYEEWIVEVTVVEVHDEAKTVKLLKETDMHALGKTRVAMRVKIDTCTYKEGHGGNHCTAGKTIPIMLSYDKAKVKEPFKKGAKIKAHYYYSDGLGPNGVVYSHSWKMITD